MGNSNEVLLIGENIQLLSCFHQEETNKSGYIPDNINENWIIPIKFI